MGSKKGSTARVGKLRENVGEGRAHERGGSLKSYMQTKCSGPIHHPPTSNLQPPTLQAGSPACCSLSVPWLTSRARLPSPQVPQVPSHGLPNSSSSTLDFVPGPDSLRSPPARRPAQPRASQKAAQSGLSSCVPGRAGGAALGHHATTRPGPCWTANSFRTTSRVVMLDAANPITGLSLAHPSASLSPGGAAAAAQQRPVQMKDAGGIGFARGMWLWRASIYVG